MLGSIHLVLTALFALLMPFAVWYLCRSLEIPTWVIILPFIASLLLALSAMMSEVFMSREGPCLAYFAVSYFMLQVSAILLLTFLFALLVHYLPDYYWLWLAVGAAVICALLGELVHTLHGNGKLLVTFVTLSLVALTSAVTMQVNMGTPLLPWMEIDAIFLASALALGMTASNLGSQKCTQVNVMVANITTECDDDDKVGYTTLPASAYLDEEDLREF